MENNLNRAHCAIVFIKNRGCVSCEVPGQQIYKEVGGAWRGAIRPRLAAVTTTADLGTGHTCSRTRYPCRLIPTHATYACSLFYDGSECEIETIIQKWSCTSVALISIMQFHRNCIIDIRNCNLNRIHSKYWILL